MNNQEINISNLSTAIDEIQKYLDDKHHTSTEPYVAMHHKLDFEKALNLAVNVFKQAINDLQGLENNTKFYAPIWVSKLLARLSSDEPQLSDVEYNLFKDMVRRLEFSDYKSASAQDFSGYEVQYANPQEIMEAIVALKAYFKLM